MSLSTLDLEALADRSVVATPTGSIAQLAVSDSPDGPVRLWLVPGHSGAFVSEVVSAWGVTLLRRGARNQPLRDLASLLIELHAQVAMDTDEDRELHARAVASFREALAEVSGEPLGPELTTSDEPARSEIDQPPTCEHGWAQAHNQPLAPKRGVMVEWRRCPGPAASGTPEAQR